MILYSEFSLRKHINAPQFNRMRHRFRGPRESEKINLEMNQLYYSIHKQYEIQQAFNDKFVTYAENILDGAELTGLGFNGEGDIEIPGLSDMAKRIDALDRRVRALEA